MFGAPPRLVLDTKYGRTMVEGSWNRADIHQITFYAHAMGCPGVLLYPEGPDSGPIETRFEVGRLWVEILTIDLHSPGLPGLGRLDPAIEERLGLVSRQPTG